MAIAPPFPRVGAGFATTLLHGALISSTGGMRFNLVGLAPDDVDVATIGFPPRNAGRKVLVSISKTAIVLFLGSIDWRFRIWVTALPEKLPKFVTFFIGRELQIGLALFWR